MNCLLNTDWSPSFPIPRCSKSRWYHYSEDDLYHQTPGSIVENTISQLGEHYKVQANPRAVNLFYLKDGVRELIEYKNDAYEVRNTQLRFSKAEMAVELNDHPERFSPNVILRGLYQETILPNIAFIGGGGETSYWLELKELFHHYKVPYPVLVVRNSFLIVENKWEEKIERMGLQISDFFQPSQQLLTQLVTRQSNGHLKLAKELEATSQLYDAIREKASLVDETLLAHIEALKARTVKPLQELEKKMIRAEKRKYEAEQQQIQQIRKRCSQPVDCRNAWRISCLTMRSGAGSSLIAFIKAVWRWSRSL